MFTDANLKTLIFITNLSWYMGTTHYYFKKSPNPSPSTYKLATTFTRSRALYLCLTFSLSSFYVLFLSFRLGQKLLFAGTGGDSDPSTSLAYILRMCYYICVYFIPVLLQANTMWNWKEIPRFIFQYHQFLTLIRAKYAVPSAKGVQSKRFFSAVMFIAVATTVQNSIVLLKKPYKEHFLTSLLKEPISAPLSVKGPILLVSILIWLLTWINICVVAFHFYMYMTGSIYLLKELNPNVRSAQTLDSLRSPMTSARTLRSLQMLHRLWQFCYEDFLCPVHKGDAMVIAILGTYGVIKLTGISSIIMGLAALFSLLYLLTLFYKFAQLNELSERAIDRWRGKGEVNKNKYLKTLFRSIPDFRVRVGSYYHVKKVTVCILFWQVMNNTITLLML